MNSTILSYLEKQTEEEVYALKNAGKVEQSLYTNQNFFMVESEKFLNSDQLMMMRKHTRFVNFPLHSHNYVEINYVVRGEMIQIINGEKVHLKAGELILLNQYIAHEILASTTEDLIINFIIHPSFFERIYQFLNSDNIIQQFIIGSRFDTTQQGQSLIFRGSMIPVLQETIEKLLAEMLSPSRYSEETLTLYMGIFLLELAKHPDLIEQQYVDAQYPLIVDALNYIDKFYQKASLEDLSITLKQSYSAMSRIIKKHTGYNFKYLVQEKRLYKACSFLQNTTLPITEIASVVGYDNYSYFYRLFQQKYKMTPGEFRQQFAKKDNDLIN